MKLEDSKNRYHGPRETFRAAGNVVAAAGVLPFLVITGGADKVVRIQRIIISGMTLTAVAYLQVSITKHSSAWTGGVPVTAENDVPLDSTYPAAPGPRAVVQSYTAGPTGGGAIVGTTGRMAERRLLGQATVAAAAAPPASTEISFSDNNTNEGPALRSAAESLAVRFAAAPATAVTLSYEVEWTEDGN